MISQPNRACVRLSLPSDDLLVYVTRLLEMHAPDGRPNALSRIFPLALERTERCFSRVALPHYRDERGGATFDHLHGDQFATFLYFAANTAWAQREDVELAKKLTMLNRDRHGLLVMYDTQLPQIFVIPHTVGTVIGKGSYGEFTVFCQNVTVTNDGVEGLDVGSGVIFFPGSFAGGRSTIGDGSVLTANSTVSYENIPANTMVRGVSPHLEQWPRTKDLLSRFFTPPYPGSDAAR
jgi:serine O-acetyltransferase